MAEDRLPGRNQAESPAGVFGPPNGETPSNFQAKANSGPAQHGPPIEPRISHGQPVQASNHRSENDAAGNEVRQGSLLQSGGQPAPSGEQRGTDKQSTEPEAAVNGGEGVPQGAPPPAAAAASLDSSAQAAGPEHPPPRDSQEGGAARLEGQTLHSEVAQEPIIVSVGDRRVKLSSEADPSSLYSLCRKWVRNRPGEDEELGFAPIVPSVLPKPLPAEQAQRESDAITAVNAQELNPPSLIPRDLLKSHVRGFREVRKRKREEWQRRVQRYKPRLCLIFPPGAAAVADKKDGKGEARR